MLRKVLEALGVVQPQDSFPYYQTSGAPPGNMYGTNLPTMQPSVFTHMYPPPPNRVEHVPDPRARFEVHPTALYPAHGPHTFPQYTFPPYPIGPAYANHGPPLPSSGAQPEPQVSQGHPYSQNWPTDPQGSLVPTTTPEVMRKDPREALIDTSTSYPTGYVRQEVVLGTQSQKSFHTKWAWRSNGNTMHEGRKAETRCCLGVIRCGSCGRLTRPKTQTAARNTQIQAPCSLCGQTSPQTWDKCDAKTFHFTVERNGVIYVVWEHFGDHDHGHPPGGTLSKAEQAAV